MRSSSIGLVLLVAAACDAGEAPAHGPGDDAAPPVELDAAAVDASALDGTPPPPVDAATDAPADAAVSIAPFVAFRPPAPLPAGMCAPAAGDWTGSASVYYRGTSGNHTRYRADVTWTLASTSGCVDRYLPTGTVSVDRASDCCHGYAGDASKPLGAGDGELVVDRSTMPPTFRMHGESRWPLPQSCPVDEESLCDWSGPDTGGVWASVEGELDGDVFAATYGEGFPFRIAWRFTRVGAILPSTPCSAPVVDRWSGVAAMEPFSHAEVNWTRVSTVGCRDTYRPEGTAHHVPHPWNYCASWSMSPDEGAVNGDGELVIDRTTPVPTFTMRGGAHWDADGICRHPDGTVATTSTTAQVTWADGFTGVVQGDRFAGATTDGPYTYRWAAHALP